MAKPKDEMGLLMLGGKAPPAEEPTGEDEDAPGESEQDEKDAYADMMTAQQAGDEEAGRIALKRFVMACKDTYGSDEA